MRLLNTSTLKLELFLAITFRDTPKYAILSHRWEDEEIVFEDVRDGPKTIPRHKKGFAKVQGSARYAKAQGFDWIWIDTCCIDKSSSAELSEAINSMFRWYRRAQVCLAYLSDVRSPGDLQFSKWFTRGWTLQELIAPAKVEFIDMDWNLIGNRTQLATHVSGMTGIDVHLLRGISVVGAYSIATRMAWASHRQTTRREDLAYSLLGIFNVTMPLIYGEGQQSAFRRLQEEIIKNSSDQSIFSFRHRFYEGGPPPYVVANLMTHYLASSPFDFGEGATVMDDDPYDKNHTALHPITLHPHGVTFRAVVGPATYHLDSSTTMKAQLVILNCCLKADPLARPVFLVTDFDGLLARLQSPLLRALPHSLPGEEGAISIQSVGWGPGPGPKGAWVVAGPVDGFAEQMVTISEPPRSWSPERPHPRQCRLSTTSKHFFLSLEQDHSPMASNEDYLVLETVFGHLGTILVQGPELDHFHILWGYAIDSSSAEFKVYGTNRLQYFGRRSIDAWKTQTPRCIIAEPSPQWLQPVGAPRPLRAMDITCSLLGGICSLEIPEVGRSDLPSWTISRRPSGLVVRVDVRLRTFLNRTCVEVEISDCTADGENIPMTLAPAPEAPAEIHPEDTRQSAPTNTQSTAAD